MLRPREGARQQDHQARTYDTTTGKLTELTYDRNKNGIIDTWTDMNGSSRSDRGSISTKTGKIDRWEYYDDKGARRRSASRERTMARRTRGRLPAPDGSVARVEHSIDHR